MELQAATHVTILWALEKMLHQHFLCFQLPELFRDNQKHCNNDIPPSRRLCNPTMQAMCPNLTYEKGFEMKKERKEKDEKVRKQYSRNR